MPLPELNKKPGVCYAFSDAGVELPVIDITHPGFHQELGQDQLDAAYERYVQAQLKMGALARWAQAKILPFFLKRSVIGRGLLKSIGGYLDGMSTYLMKLPPALLGAAWASPMDRKLVEGMNRSGMSLGQRLQDMAESLAAGLRPLLQADAKRPLQLLNIAGGPSMDSLNALILLYKAAPELFAQRKVELHVLDLENEGPHFAAASLAALQAPGAPLHGLGATLSVHAYDWAQPQALVELLEILPSNSILALSSEGGLFDYGDDAGISANLQALHAHSAHDAVVVASLSPPGKGGSPFQRQGIAKVVKRSVESFGALAQSAGWELGGEPLERPIFAVVQLFKA